MRPAQIVILTLLLVLLGACSTAPPPAPEVVRVVETVRVEVPVAVHREVPPQLAEPFTPEALPEFVAPDDPAATSALTPEGERRLRLLLHDLRARLRAWRAWATDPGEDL